ncbi:protein Flattop [Dicentrarchus labrax]|uniref:Protein Flattop n=1 Tax=Dicentrarchus labrax TaxID=13489 RepID=A0A8C4E4G0_DICLA|nr:protein Flattop [Dicentrarchus labrax]
MSSSYSANQYDSAFRSQRLQNWCETKHFKERPTAQEGHTTFIADNRGHLLPGVVKRGSAWPDFKGTWDLPARIPAHNINPTGRSLEGLNRLKSWGFDPRHTGKSQPRRGGKTPDGLQSVGEQTNGGVQLDNAALSSAAEARPASQNLPVTEGERSASQNQDLQAVVVGSIGQPAEEKRANQATGKVRPLSQCSAAEENPALRPAAGEGRSVSHVAEKVASQRAPSSTKQTHRDAQQDQ